MQQEPKKYLISIIPLTRISLIRDQFFYYLAENPVPKGTLCEVPFGYRRIKGIVLESKTDFQRVGGMRLKRINKILNEKFLTEEQLQLAQFISEYYLCPLGIVLKHFLPTQAKSRKKEADSEKSQAEIQKAILSNQRIIDKIINSQNTSKSFILKVEPNDDKENFILNLIQQEIKNHHSNSNKQEENKQILYLLPEVSQTLEIEQKLLNHFSKENVVLLHSKITKGQFFENWEKVRNGQAKIIIGTRAALFTPFKNLSLIITDNHTDISYKQWDMNPRYDTRTLVLKLSELFNCTNLNISTFPRTTDYFHATEKNENDTTLLNLKSEQNFSTKINVVDMKKERWKKRYSPISQELEFKLHNILNKKQQALLFINRQGLSAFSICLKCKTPLKCPQCQRALIGKKDGAFHCLHCNYSTDIFPKCNKCSSLEFNNIGTGTEKIETILKKIFPKAKITRIDQSVAKKFSEVKKTHNRFSQGKIDILIGTQMIMEGWNSPNLTLTSILDMDNLTSLPEYDAQEKSFSFLLSLLNKVSKKNNGELLIQTFNEYNPIFEAMKKSDFEKIYSNELETRKALSYPPFSRLIKLVYRSSKQEDVEKITKLVHAKIQEKISKNNFIIITPPHAPLLNKIRTQYRQQIIIKCKKNELPKSLVDELKKLDSKWIVDIDPI
ncbi:MAG: primosomal protein N', partial [Candidatus Moranbacteria bacterium]|nr:primosomal protein N' [Candidatus Moranbacteria bacterium]